MKKTLNSKLLIPIILAVFLTMTVSLALALPKCSILPANDQTKVEYCPTCPEAPEAKARVDHKPTPGSSGCSAADDVCAAWMYQWTNDVPDDEVCDLTQDVHVCKSVCKDANAMPTCAQAPQPSTVGSTIEASWWWWPFDVHYLDFMELGGCCNPENGDTECQVGYWIGPVYVPKYPWRHCQRERYECYEEIDKVIRPGIACCSDTGYECNETTDCCSLNDICQPTGYLTRGYEGRCVDTGLICESTDPPYLPENPYGNSPYEPGRTTCAIWGGSQGECIDRCASNTLLQECYCIKEDNYCQQKTIDCNSNQICEYGGRCLSDSEGKGYCKCNSPPVTTRPKLLNCKDEGGFFIMGSGGCMRACEAQGKWGICEFTTFETVGRDCCCFCVGERSTTSRTVGLSSFTNAVIVIVIVAVIVVVIYSFMRTKARKKR